MSHKIEEAYKNVRPPAFLITSTLEKVKKQRLRQSLILLLLQWGICAILCFVLAFFQSPAICVGIFVILCVGFVAAFLTKNKQILEEKYMSDDNTKLSDDLLDAAVGGTEDNQFAFKELRPVRCTNCGLEVPGKLLSEPCPHCGFTDEQFMPKE